MIKLLIVDDSETETLILKHIFQSAPDFEIVGYAKNGQEALNQVRLLKPDIVTMDVHMPLMSGIEATRLIMSECPLPIVVISSKLQDIELNASFYALEAGALSVLEKPVNINSPHFESIKNNIISTIRNMAQIKVIKRRFTKKTLTKAHVPKVKPLNNYELIAIGTSVGGPQALKMILSNLPDDFSLPIVIVQHMTLGFIEGFAKWLNNNIDLRVKIAEQGELLNPGIVYFAPDDFHLKVIRKDGQLIAHLVKGELVSGFRPSATELLKSVAEVCGESAIGILLTGMGNDGAEGMLALKKAHGHTLIQDPESAVVFGMPGVALSLDAVDKIIELNRFASYLKNMASFHSANVE